MAATWEDGAKVRAQLSRTFVAGQIPQQACLQELMHACLNRICCAGAADNGCRLEVKRQ